MTTVRLLSQSDLGNGEGMSVTEYIAECQIRGHRPDTIRTRRVSLVCLAQFLGRPPSEATADDLTRWIVSLGSKSPATRYTYAASAAAFYTWAVKRGRIAHNPMDAAPMPRRPQSRPRPIPDADMLRSLRAAKGDLHTWLTLGFFAGLRAGEVARLRREQVVTDAAPPFVEVIDGKGGKDRRVVVGRVVTAAVSGYPARRGALWDATPNLVTRTVSAHFRELEMPYTFHSARHTFATRLYRASHDLRVVQAALGHASPVTTAVYAEPASLDAIAAIAAIEEGFAA